MERANPYSFDFFEIYFFIKERRFGDASPKVGKGIEPL